MRNWVAHGHRVVEHSHEQDGPNIDICECPGPAGESNAKLIELLPWLLDFVQDFLKGESTANHMYAMAQTILKQAKGISPEPSSVSQKLNAEMQEHTYCFWIDGVGYKSGRAVVTGAWLRNFLPPEHKEHAIYKDRKEMVTDLLICDKTEVNIDGQHFYTVPSATFGGKS